MNSSADRAQPPRWSMDSSSSSLYTRVCREQPQQNEFYKTWEKNEQEELIAFTSLLAAKMTRKMYLVNKQKEGTPRVCTLSTQGQPEHTLCHRDRGHKGYTAGLSPACQSHPPLELPNTTILGLFIILELLISTSHVEAHLQFLIHSRTSNPNTDFWSVISTGSHYLVLW